LHPPKSPIATAIRYALNRWTELGRFLEDARVPLDNNASERSLRRVVTSGSLCVTPSSAWKHERAGVGATGYIKSGANCLADTALPGMAFYPTSGAEIPPASFAAGHVAVDQ
jgi:transposase